MNFFREKKDYQYFIFFVISFVLLTVFFLFSFAKNSEASGLPASADNQEQKIIEKLRSEHLALLTEKGICDDQGKDIDGRLVRLIQEAKSKGFVSDQKIVNFILERLNFSKTNLGRFPSCAFDRPIGYKLTQFGHTISPENIDATAEGSACPAGGIGAGAFEWTMSGNFRYWFLKPGWMVDDTIWANQFHVFMKKGKKAIFQTLSADAPPSSALLKSWKWNYPSGKGSYFALFPKSGFSYEKNEAFPAKIAVTQFSPVIPNNYKETSYPVAIYKWIIENTTSERIEISVMLTWENMIGWEAENPNPLRPADFSWNRNSPGIYNEFVEDGNKKGIVFRKKDTDIKFGNALTGTVGIATAEIPGKTTVFYHGDFDPTLSGDEVWQTFAKDGTLSNSQTSRTATSGEELAGAIAVKFTLRPREHFEFPIVIAWDFPFYEFEKGTKIRRKYTEFFGADGENAFAIASEALDHYKIWEKSIDDGQNEIVQNPRFPDWLKQVLFNELYVLAETSIWDASTGLHTYLESADYLMYGTFDVDSYCWHLLKLWPEIELHNMKFFARTIDWEDPAYKAYQYPVIFPKDVPSDKMSYYWNMNKVYGMVPHDIGSPRKRPWVILNAFDWQNGNVWKDLNPKFPLRAYRDFQEAGSNDFDFLKKMFKASVLALDTLENRFGDSASHLPLNEGIPDQTYDTWRMKGEGAYVGILWLAALKSTSAMGQQLMEKGIAEMEGVSIKSVVEKYRAWFDTGRQALQKLWNEKGGYFNIDAYTDDIMTDQLFGLWYSKMIGLEEIEEQRIVPPDQVKKSLRTIYEKNVLGFGDGLLGAVNGRTSAGKQLFSQQGDEVWVGTTYAFASNCILHGLVEEGLHAAYGIYHVVYSPCGQGYFFKTPEAYLNPEEFQWNKPSTKYGEKLFRAMKYMRPGAVWAVAEALLKNPGKGS